MRGPCLLLLLGLCACWDFDALHRAPEVVDSRQPEDLRPPDLLCDRNSVQENCTNGVDDNHDCLVDCEDPQCHADPACKDLRPLGYGTLAGATTCPDGSQPSFGKILEAGLQGLPTCSGCKCNAACTSTLRVFDSAMKCDMNKDKDLVGKVDVSTVAGQGCQKLITSTGYYTLPASAPACVADPGIAKPDVAIAEQSALCLPIGANTRCTTVSCMLQEVHGKLCVVFDGDPGCPASLPVKKPWFIGYADKRTCACCTDAPGGSCDDSTVSLLHDADACGGGTPTKLDNRCISSSTAKSVEYKSSAAKVTCTNGGAAKGTDLKPLASYTTCCAK